MARGVYDHRREYHGGSHKMVLHEQRQTGDPQQIALREPPGYEHPQPLGRDVLDPGGPRILPVSGRITHGPQEQDQEEAFIEQVVRGLAADLHAYHSVVLFNDRRDTGRRYRNTDAVDELLTAPQEPPEKGWQRDIPLDRYRSI